MPERISSAKIQHSPSDTNINTFKTIVDRLITAYATEDYETVMRLYSRDSRSQLFSGLGTLALLRALDNNYQDETAALKAKLTEIEQSAGTGYDILDASFEVQGLSLQTILESLKPQFEQLNRLNRYKDLANSGYELEILSLKDNTAVVLLTPKVNSDRTEIYKFIKRNEQWLFATETEIEIARTPEGSLHYISPGLLPLSESVSYLSDKPSIKSTANWYRTLPPTTAEEKGIKVGDAVVGYIETKIEEIEFEYSSFYNFRVISLEEGTNGDRATLIRQDNKIITNVPLAVLYKVENYLNRTRLPQLGDVVFLNQWANTTLARISRLEGSQIYLKYVKRDWVEEEVPQGIIVPLPQDSYVLRKVLYQRDGKLKTGIAIAEDEANIWINSYSSEIITVKKIDAKPIEPPDMDLGVGKVWTTRGYIREVQIIRVIEPGLLYEIDEQNSDGKYRLLSFDEIWLSKPTVDELKQAR